MELKTCTKCNKDLDLKYFEVRKDTGKIRNYCKKCNKGYLTNREDVVDNILLLYSLGQKECAKCKKVKDLECFSKDKYTITQHSSSCKQCIKEFGILNIDNRKNSRLKTKYNINLNIYNTLYNDQEGKCKICNIYLSKLNVDHNHTTGNFRGLLCHHCNAGLGHFKDNKEVLLNAINYLDNNYETNNI